MQNRKIPSGQQNTQERETYLSFILFSFNHIHVNGLSNHLIIIGIDLLRWQLQEYFYQLTSLNLDTEVDKSNLIKAVLQHDIVRPGTGLSATFEVGGFGECRPRVWVWKVFSPSYWGGGGGEFKNVPSFCGNLGMK